GVELLDAVEHPRGQLDRGDLAGADRPRCLEGRGEVEIGGGGARGPRREHRRRGEGGAADQEGTAIERGHGLTPPRTADDGRRGAAPPLSLLRSSSRAPR